MNNYRYYLVCPTNKLERMTHMMPLPFGNGIDILWKIRSNGSPCVQMNKCVELTGCKINSLWGTSRLRRFQHEGSQKRRTANSLFHLLSAYFPRWVYKQTQWCICNIDVSLLSWVCNIEVDTKQCRLIKIWIEWHRRCGQVTVGEDDRYYYLPGICIGYTGITIERWVICCRRWAEYATV